VCLAHSGDIRTVQFFPGAGSEACPCEGDTVVVERVGGLLYSGAVWDNIQPELKLGEVELYSRDTEGVKKARHIFKQDGKHFVGNDEGNLYAAFMLILDRMKGITTTGSPGAHTINEAYQQQLEQDKQEIEAFLTGDI